MRSTFYPWERFSKHPDYCEAGDLISPSKLSKVTRRLAFAAMAMNVCICLHACILIQVHRVVFLCSRVMASYSLLQKAVLAEKFKGNSFLAAIVYREKRYNKWIQSSKSEWRWGSRVTCIKTRKAWWLFRAIYWGSRRRDFYYISMYSYFEISWSVVCPWTCHFLSIFQFLYLQQDMKLISFYVERPSLPE